MFRCVEVVRLAAAFLSGVACLHAPLSARAQSIGDYSRAQRAVIESAIARQGNRPPVELPGLAPSLPSHREAGNAPALPASPLPPPPPPSRPADPPSPDIAVTGVIVSPSVTLTEVVVDGTPFLLSAGQRVPGTPWLVSRVDADQVTLSMEPRSRGAKPATRTFLLANSGS